MALYPGALLPWIELRFFLADGTLNAGGFLYSYEAGTSTLQPLYTDALLTTAAPNPVTLGSDGRPPGPLYLLPTGYRFEVQDSNGVDVPGYSEDMIEDVGQVFASTFGNVLATGSTNVVSGYQVLTTDQLVTVNSTGGANPCVVNLPPANTYTNYLCIKNMGTTALAVRPNGTDTIDQITPSADFTVPAAASPTFPAIELVSDGISAWYIRASHGL